MAIQADACERAARPVVDEQPPTDSAVPEVSVVMPCLNESESVGICVAKAVQALAEAGIRGEVIVADNGSTDASAEIAAGLGAHVVHVAARGYGNALMGGIQAARGHYIVMGYADNSYDFHDVPRFVAALRQGAELVQGCRLPAGGGKVMPGAMPFLHRWLGNPALSAMVRVMFRSTIHDIYCGMRGFTRSMYDSLDLRCTGMEFATEMVVKATLNHHVIAEIPIVLFPDSRRAHRPHLRTFRDGWRTIRFYVMYSPRWLFLIPGTLAVTAGLCGYLLALPGVRLGPATFDVHTLLFASLAIILGHQAWFFALFAKTFAISERLLPRDARLDAFFRFATLERGLILGGLLGALGLAMLGVTVVQWVNCGFGYLEYHRTMRVVIPGSTLVALGFQTVFSSFFVSILGLHRK